MKHEIRKGWGEVIFNLISLFIVWKVFIFIITHFHK